MSYNKISIIGNLGRDAVVRYLPSGEPVADFSIATSEKNKDGETVTWFKATLWGKRAESLAQYLTKGAKIYLEGRLKQTSYTDREGVARTSLEVNVSEVQLLGSRSDGAQSEPANAPPRKPESAPQSDNTDDIPF